MDPFAHERTLTEAMAGKEVAPGPLETAFIRGKEGHRSPSTDPAEPFNLRRWCVVLDETMATVQERLDELEGTLGPLLAPTPEGSENRSYLGFPAARSGIGDALYGIALRQTSVADRLRDLLDRVDV